MPLDKTLGITVATEFKNNVNILGQLTVKGATVLGASLTVEEAVILNGSLTVNGDTVIEGNLKAQDLQVGTIQATSITGSGADLDNLNANNITQGTLADARLSQNVALLNRTQTFAGSNTFTNNLLLNNNLTLQANGAIMANTLQQTAAGQNMAMNAGNDTITFTAGGRTFIFPTIGPASQQICTTSITCTAPGGTAVLLNPTSAQPDTLAEPSIFINDTGGGNLLHLQSGGTDRFVVANNGNTTVAGSLNVSGTTTLDGLSAGATSLASLATGGNASIGGTLGIAGLSTFSVLGSADNAAYLCRNSTGQLASCSTTGTGAAFVQGGNSFGAIASLGTNDAFDLQLETGGTPKLTIQNSTGNVGIGTTAPGAKLQVSSASVDGEYATKILNTTVYGYGLLVSTAMADLDFTRPILSLENNGIKRLTVVANGNVGIGTTAPGYKLHVIGTGTVRNYTESTDGIALLQAKGATKGSLLLEDAGATSGQRNYQWVSDGGLLYTRLLSDDENTVLIDNILVMNSSGNVGIGTAAPDAKLHVTGSAHINGIYLGYAGTNSIGDAVNGDALRFSSGNTLLNPTSGSVGIGITNPGAKLHVNTGAAGTIGQIIQGVASQTADLQQWQNSAGTILARVDAAGSVKVDADGQGFFVAGGAGIRKIIGASGLNIYGGGSDLIRMNGSTGLYLDQLGGPVAWGGTPPSGWGGGTTMLIQSQVLGGGNAGVVPITVMGLASQTADLQQWQNSVGTVLARVDANGNGYFNNGSGGTGAAFVQGGNSFGAIASLGTNDAFDLQLETGGTPKLTVQNSTGNVGIGATNPSQKLEVSGNSLTSGEVRTGTSGQYASLSYTASQGSLSLAGGSTTWTFNGANVVNMGDLNARQITSDLSGAGSGNMFMVNDGVNWNLALSSSLGISFNPGGSLAMRLTPAGNVGIGTASPGGKLHVQGTDDAANTVLFAAGADTVAAGVPNMTLQVKGGLGQTADLQQWQNSGGVALARISSTGAAQFPIGTSINSTAIGQTSLTVTSGGDPGTLPILVRGAASQTADLQQWQDSAGTVISRVKNNGAWLIGTDPTGAALAVNNDVYGAGAVGIIVKGAAGQSTDLQRWLNSSGTVLASLKQDGAFKGPYLQNVAETGSYIDTSLNGGIGLVQRAASSVAMTVRGAAGQTADLLQAQDSTGAVLASISATGNLTAKNATFNGTLSVNGHIITGNTSGTTTVAAGAAACTTPTVTISGNDAAGTITVTTGTGCAATGVLATVTFANAYGAAPRVTLTPANANGTNLKYFNGASTITTFTLDTNAAPADSTTYTFNYFVAQ